MNESDVLERGLRALGIELPASARAKLLAYAALLLKWNRSYNLTAIREPRQVVSHHLLDSLAVLPHLAGFCSIADIGSGGGLPGIPLAVARPDLDVMSVEAVNKKSTFQRQAKIELELDNFHPQCARVERFALATTPDAVISRAFSDLGEFVRLTGHLLGPEGRFLAMKGVYPNEEIAALPDGVVLEAAIELQVPEVDASRHLIILRRDGSA